MLGAPTLIPVSEGRARDAPRTYPLDADHDGAYPYAVVVETAKEVEGGSVGGRDAECVQVAHMRQLLSELLQFRIFGALAGDIANIHGGGEACSPVEASRAAGSGRQLLVACQIIFSRAYAYLRAVITGN